MNGNANCILELCCPPEAARDSFSALMQEKTGLGKDYTDQCAAFVYEHFDLAERGTLKALKQSIVKAHEHRPK